MAASKRARSSASSDLWASGASAALGAALTSGGGATLLVAGGAISFFGEPQPASWARPISHFPARRVFMSPKRRARGLYSAAEAAGSTEKRDKKPLELPEALERPATAPALY